MDKIHIILSQQDITFIIII